MKQLLCKAIHTPEEFDWLQEHAIDITMPPHVEVHIDKVRSIVWVNIGGICALRACRVGEIDVKIQGGSSDRTGN